MDKAKLYIEYQGEVSNLLADLNEMDRPRGVWSDRRYREWNEHGGITVNGEPYAAKINPASVDLALDRWVRRPQWWWNNPVTRRLVWWCLPDARKDMKKKENVSIFWREPVDFSEITIWPGEFVLMNTVECVTIPNDALGIIRLKSTSGRQGFESVDAGIIDPGFNSNITLEFFNVAPWPIRVNYASFYVQMVLIDMSEPCDEPYNGRYQHQGNMPTPAKEEVT